jgi:hypothetical protein
MEAGRRAPQFVARARSCRGRFDGKVAIPQTSNSFTGGNAIWSEPSAALGSWTEPRCPVAAIDGTNITDGATLQGQFHQARDVRRQGI